MEYDTTGFINSLDNQHIPPPSIEKCIKDGNYFLDFYFDEIVIFIKYMRSKGYKFNKHERLFFGSSREIIYNIRSQFEMIRIINELNLKGK